MPFAKLTLLTGATGFVGGTLLDALRDDGPLRLLVRDAGGLAGVDTGAAEVVEADLGDRDSLKLALDGVAVAYYLVHSMESASGSDFAERDRRAAENFAAQARHAGVERVIYMGGVGSDEEDSEHLESRREVEAILAGAAPELVVLRASMIVGAGSASFGALARIVDRMPVLAMPEWGDRCTQPVGIDDVVACLAAARTVAPGTYEIAGPDRLTFERMTEVIAGLLGAEHRSVKLPFSNSKLEAAAASLVTGEDRELLEPLMEGLHGDLTVADNKMHGVFGVTPTPFAEAARDALAGMRDREAA